MKITVLGCGGSLGTPAAGGFWEDCDPKNPRNRRSRASLLVQTATTNILIDSSPDVRMQFSDGIVQRLDGVLLSHAHSDHINGLDDLRAFSKYGNALLNVYGSETTLNEVDNLWPHIFRDRHGGLYKPFACKNVVAEYGRFSVGDIDIKTFAQDHATCISLGYRFGSFAYSVDVANLDEKALAALEGVETWMVDCCSWTNKEVYTHANFERVLGWIDRLKPKITYLTVLSSKMDYQVLCDELPPHIRPAYDGMVIEA